MTAGLRLKQILADFSVEKCLSNPNPKNSTSIVPGLTQFKSNMLLTLNKPENNLVQRRSEIIDMLHKERKKGRCRFISFWTLSPAKVFNDEYTVSERKT